MPTPSSLTPRVAALKPLPRLSLWRLLGRLLIVAIAAGSLLPLPAIGPDVPAGDKWQHALAYFLLTSWYAQLCATRAALLSRALGFVALGAALELAQAFVAWRLGLDPWDMAANVAGIALGVALGQTPLARLLERLDRPRRAGA